jgi:hypothetical protein
MTEILDIGLKAICLLLAAGYVFFLYRVNKLLDLN